MEYKLLPVEPAVTVLRNAQELLQKHEEHSALTN